MVFVTRPNFENADLFFLLLYIASKNQIVLKFDDYILLSTLYYRNVNILTNIDKLGIFI